MYLAVYERPPGSILKVFKNIYYNEKDFKLLLLVNGEERVDGFNLPKKVIKRDGRIVDFTRDRIENALKRAMLATGKYDPKVLGEVVNHVLMLLTEKYGEERVPHVEDIQDMVELALVKYGLYEVAKAYILYRKQREQIREEKKKILEKDYIDEVDKSFSVNALRLMASRYLLRDPEGKLAEGPKQMFQRVAALVAIPDIMYDPVIFAKEGGMTVHPQEEFNPDYWDGKVGLGKKEDGSYEVTWNKWHLERMKNLYDELNKDGKMKLSWNEFFIKLREGMFDDHYKDYLDYYNLMVNKEFLPNSPTLFNAGARLGQLSACFVLDIDDDIQSIMNAATDAAMIFKSGGGIGINYSKLRPEGDLVFSTFGVASGPVSFMKIVDTVTEVVKQGGKRRGANMGILEVWHPDIEKFSTCKLNEGFLENFNISVLFTPDFWEYYKQNKLYPLRNPRDGEVWKAIDPKNLLETVATAAWRCADPGGLFLDNINKRNPLKKFMGDIRCTNPCIAGDARVPTSHGLVRLSDMYRMYEEGVIIDIVTDDRALSEKVLVTNHGITYRGCYDLGVKERRVAKVIKTGDKPVLEVVTEHGYSIEATEDHLFLTDKGWVKLRELKVGDKLMIQSGEGGFGKLGTEGLGRVLGWLVGDGQISNGKVTLLFYGKDKELACKLLDDIKSSLKLNLKVRMAKSRDAVLMTSRRLYNVLSSLGVRERVKVPEIVFMGSKEMQRGFLQALFTSAGTVNVSRKGYSIRLASNSTALLKDVQLLLLNFGIISRIYEDRRGAEVRLMPNGKGGKKEHRCEVYHELTIEGRNMKEFVKKIGFIDEFRQRRALKWIKYRRKDSNAEKFLSKVKEIRYVGIKEVYDVTEPITRSFIANGICVHNCGEQPLYPYESCNLGSINIHSFIKRTKDGVAFDWEKLEKTVRKALRFLDNIIDVNNYPIKRIEEATKLTRRVGLGIMGLADALFALMIPYNSEEGFSFMRRLAEFIDYYAMVESVELAKERGAFPTYNLSSYPDGSIPIEGYYRKEEWHMDWDYVAEVVKKHGIRNSHVTTIAPTGSISMLYDVSSGLEPQFALVFEKRVTVGTFYYVDQELERCLKERGLYSESLLKKIADNGGSLQGIEEVPEDIRKVFVVAYDIPWWDHIRAQYEVGKWVDSAVSKTINMPNWVTVDDVLKAYLFAYRLGLKGITIYRDGSKSGQVLVTPTQRMNRYLAIVNNKTLEMMAKLGIGMEEKVAVTPAGSQVSLSAPQQGENVSKEKVTIQSYTPSCPSCKGEKLVYQEGCVRCLDCGWSACLVA